MEIITEKDGQVTHSSKWNSDKEIVEVTHSSKRNSDKEIVIKNLTEKELFQMIAIDTNRTANRMDFFFWMSIVSIVLWLMVVLQQVSS